MERDGSWVKITPQNKGPIMKIRQKVIVIPLIFMKYFPHKYVELLFDPKKDLIALRPTEDPFNFKLTSRSTKTRNAICCRKFLRYYSITPQDIEVKWDPKNKMLIGKVKRDGR